MAALYDEICRSCGGAQADFGDRFRGSMRPARMATQAASAAHGSVSLNHRGHSHEERACC